MRIEQLVIGLVMFSLFVLGGSLLFNDMVQTYNVSVANNTMFNGSMGGNNNTVFDTLKEVNEDLTDGVQDKIVGDDASSSTTAPFDTKFNDAMSAITLARNTFKIIGKIMNQVATTLGIPTWIVTGLFMTLVIAIVFAIIYLIFRFRG